MTRSEFLVLVVLILVLISGMYGMDLIYAKL